MSVGSWKPGSASTKNATEISRAFIDRCLKLAESDQLMNLVGAMSDADKAQSAVMMATQEQWQHALNGYTDQQLIELIRFFTVVEVQLNDWHGGSHSPAIAINNLLKQRGGKLDIETLKWIRQNTTNRFIPNGAIL